MLLLNRTQCYPVIFKIMQHFLSKKNPENPGKENQLQISKYLRN